MIEPSDLSLPTQMGVVRLWQQEFHVLARSKGFHDESTDWTIAGNLMAEAAEVWEAVRNGEFSRPPRQDGKPEGVPAELADVVIRCFDAAEHWGIDLAAAIRAKHAFNKTRPHKHGKRC